MIAPALSRGQARALALSAQGLLGSPFLVSPSAAHRAGSPRAVQAVRGVVSHLGAVQLDTISTLARSHELVVYARLGAVGREAIETAYWGGGTGVAHPTDATTFEYWSHAACVLPVEEWPWFAFRRRAFARRGIRWHEVSDAAIDVVRGQLAAQGPLTTRELGGAKNGGPWWDWSAAKVAIEWLLDIGEVVCVRRVGWRRVYDLAERAIPEAIRTKAATTDSDGVVGPDDLTCLRELLLASIRVVGVGTKADLLDIHRLVGPMLDRQLVARAIAELVAENRILEVDVEGWTTTAYADPAALVALDAPQGRCRTTLLSPFDSLVWDRPRTSRVFGFDHRLEAYVPAPQRVYGYFTMPVLHGSRLVARVDPSREREALHAKQVTFEVGRGERVTGPAVRGTAKALAQAATWVGATSVSLGRVEPESARSALLGELSSG